MINQHNQLKRPLDRSNQKSKQNEAIDFQRSRSRSNRAALKASIQAALSSNEKSGILTVSAVNRGKDDASSGLSDAEVTMSNLNEAD